MKRIYLVSVFIIALSVFVSNFSIQESTYIEVDPNDSLTVLKPESYHANVDRLVNTLFSRYHYKKFNLNDSLSSDIFNRYIESLDYNKSFFLAEDLEQFSSEKYFFDDYIKAGELEKVYEIYNLYKKRLNERFDFVDSLLEKGFDFTIDEVYYYNRENAEWPETTEEANEIWRKRIKNDALSLKLTGKEWEDVKELLQKRYDNYRRNINQFNSEDVFQLLMNSYSEAVDPHTNYLSPTTSDNFKINMSLSLEGIGAQLQAEDEYTKVAEIVPGGPAYKSNLLFRGDRIIGVAQDDEEMVDVIGWRLTDVVQLIRGPKGTTVRLLVLPAKDGASAVPKEIKIVRDKVKLEEQAAKKDILEIEQDKKAYKIGVITVPAFYFDYEAQYRGEKDFKSTTKDVKILLEELKKENVDGVIVDLRNNGGGSLTEAIEMTGLFIKDGPVVQVRDADGKIDIGDDPDTSIVYDGPLGVLVNRYSASASEIFAGAIQDYERGIVVGENTFGKGTVQNLIDLNRLIPNSDEKMGQVKLTIAKYYRINGGSTQHKGVVPDINFPSAVDPEEFGESSEPSALPWDQIKSVEFEKYYNLEDLIPLLQQAHDERIKSSYDFQNILDDIQEYKSDKENDFVSLNEEVRKKERDAEEEEEFQRENDRRKENGLKLLKKGEEPSEEVKEKDPFLTETAHIIADLIKMTIG